MAQRALYRRFVRKTWRKPRYRALLKDDPVKGLMLAYLWTGPDSHTPGIYYITPGTIAREKALSGFSE